MVKKRSLKLVLHRETLLNLSSHLHEVQGLGQTPQSFPCTGSCNVFECPIIIAVNGE
jgi:hypothetical protein